MRSFCLTVDVDRDVNIPVPGMSQAGSIDRGFGTYPRYSSSAEGLRILTDMLDEMGVKATYFVEGRTLINIGAQSLTGREVGIHGFDHEDFTGTFPAHGKKDVLVKAFEIIEDLLGVRPRCSRMPYMKMSPEIPEILKNIGIKYDSSEYRSLEKQMMPYNINGIIEVPVPVGTDNKGKKIVGYLWPMHEGKRIPSDYVEMASEIENGIFVLATHSWHMAECVKGGCISKEVADVNKENVRQVINQILDNGFKTETIPEAADNFSRVN
jgi:peptidoglycan/xylan/chitin deacetylase (PgdA/CDA1 family)